MKRFNLDIAPIAIVILCFGIIIGHWVLIRPPVTRVRVETQTITVPSPYNTALADEARQLRSDLAVARASNRRIPPHVRVTTDNVSAWINLGVLREAQAAKACNLNLN